MLKLAVIVGTALAMGGAASMGSLDGRPENLAERAAAAASASPAAAICLAGLEAALGGETGPVRIGFTSTAGRCGCPDACSLASFQLNMAGLTLRL